MGTKGRKSTAGNKATKPRTKGKPQRDGFIYLTTEEAINLAAPLENAIAHFGNHLTDSLRTGDIVLITNHPTEGETVPVRNHFFGMVPEGVGSDMELIKDIAERHFGHVFFYGFPNIDTDILIKGGKTTIKKIIGYEIPASEMLPPID